MVNVAKKTLGGCVVAMVGSKVVGTFAALALFIPAAHIIAFVANYI